MNHIYASLLSLEVMDNSTQETKLHQHRSHFLALANKSYFNYGGQGVLPQAAIEAIHQAQIHIQMSGPFASQVYSWQLKEAAATRSAIASELHVSPQTISLTENVTMGCNIAMWGINWQAGDHLLLTDCEHHAVIAIAQAIQQRFNVEVTTCPILNAANPTAVIQQHLRPNTRLVVISHILWNTGEVLEVDKIAQMCSANNTRLLVDAAQSVGTLPLNLTELGVDFYAFTGHKWLCGPAGLGGLYVSPSAQESLQPTFVGWRSVTTDVSGQPQNLQPHGERYEIATSDYSLMAGLRHAIALHNQWGNAVTRYQQILQNSEYLWRKLSQLKQVKCLLNSPPPSGLVSFQLTNQKSQTQLVKHLETQGLFVRTISYPDSIRVCVHYFTLESEMDQLVAEIEKF
jgi:L-cysteine/cystine lyase